MHYISGNLQLVHRCNAIVKKFSLYTYEIYCWKATQLLYPELDLYYKMVRNISVNVWWQIAACSPSVQAQFGVWLPSLQCNCNSGASNADYVVSRDSMMQCISFSQCPALETTRNNTWAAVLDVLQNAMAADMSRKSWHAVSYISYCQDLETNIFQSGKQSTSALHVSYI